MSSARNESNRADSGHAIHRGYDGDQDPLREVVRMPSPTRLARIVRIVTLPETRGVIAAAVHSDTVRELARRAVNDRAGLARDLRDPANARELLRSAARHPAARELASAGLLFLPVRYMPLGIAATWAANKVVRRFVDPPTEVIENPAFGSGSRKNVSPDRG
jgi:hypothetical protein